jgi:hypothetical protein
MCSELTDDEFNRLFHPFFGADMLFNIIRGPDADLSLSKCNWSDFEHVAFRVQQFNNLAINLTGKYPAIVISVHVMTRN